MSLSNAIRRSSALAASQEHADEVRADEPGGAGDEDRSLEYSWWNMPSDLRWVTNDLTAVSGPSAGRRRHRVARAPVTLRVPSRWQSEFRIVPENAVLVARVVLLVQQVHQHDVAIGIEAVKNARRDHYAPAEPLPRAEGRSPCHTWASPGGYPQGRPSPYPRPGASSQSAADGRAVHGRPPPFKRETFHCTHGLEDPSQLRGKPRRTSRGHPQTGEA